MVHRSPDRTYVLLALIVTGAAGPVTMATEPRTSTASWIAAGAVCAGCWWLGWRAWRTRTVLGDEALADVRMLRRFVVPRADVVGTSVSRASGFLDGFCLFLHLRDGSTHEVAGTRVYLVAPSKAHLEDLERFREAVDLWSGDGR